MGVHVFSTLTSDNTYSNYEKGENDLPRLVERVLIKGGSNVATKRLITPLGVMTTITEEELAICQRNEVFKKHVENGFITVEKKKHDPEVVAADMTLRDKSSPIVPGDFTDKDRAKPQELR